MMARGSWSVAGLLVCALVFAGCGGGDGDDGANEPMVRDNTRFFGTYNVSGTWTFSWTGRTVTDTFVHVLGDDITRKDEQHYWYIPTAGTNVTYSGTQADGDTYTTTITISGQTITEHNVGHDNDLGDYVEDVVNQFSEDYRSGTVTGTVTFGSGRSVSGTLTLTRL